MKPSHSSRFKLIPSEGRLATLPIRVMGLALYISIFAVEIIFWNFGWCGSQYGLSYMLIVFVVLGLFVVVEFVEQWSFITKPALITAISVIILRIILVEIVGDYSCSGFHTFFALIPPLLAYLYIGPRAALITALINIVLYVNWIFEGAPLTLEFMREENIPVEFFITIVAMIMILVLGRTLVLEERNRIRSERLYDELQESQLQLTELAKVEERNRIARDIHDSVGHHLMAVTIQLEKARAFREISPQEADQALDDAQQATHLALSDVRESVSTLRESGTTFELGPALAQLIENFDRIPTKLTICGDEKPHRKPMLVALYRAAQEGLTNIEKHANATAAGMHVTLEKHMLTLILEDNGVGIDVVELETKASTSKAHFGLTGLRERLALLGGTLTVTCVESGGTKLSVQLPVKLTR
ncbi:MAG: sensor histidine kinase [Chloroflexota bacterium]